MGRLTALMSLVPAYSERLTLKNVALPLTFLLPGYTRRQVRGRSATVNQNIRPSMWWKGNPSVGVIMIMMGYIAIRIPEAEPFSRVGAALAPALKWLHYMTVI